MTPLDPTIRVLCLVVFAAGLARADAPQLLLAAAALAVLYAVLGPRARRGLSGALRRVRWLLLSLVVVYGWVDPGPRLVPAWGGWSPGTAGLAAGAVRAAALAGMVIAVHALIRTTPRHALLGALYQLGRPLARCGDVRARFAVRAMLVLEQVPRIQALAREAGRAHRGAPSLRRRAADTATALYGDVLAAAASAPLTPVRFERPAPPPARQWLAPVLVAAVMAGAGWL